MVGPRAGQRNGLLVSVAGLGGKLQSAGVVVHRAVVETGVQLCPPGDVVQLGQRRYQCLLDRLGARDIQ